MPIKCLCKGEKKVLPRWVDFSPHTAPRQELQSSEQPPQPHSSCECKGRRNYAPKGEGKGLGEGQTGWPDRTLEFWIPFSNQCFCGLGQVTYLLWTVIFLVCKTRSSDTSIGNFCYFNVCVREAVSTFIFKNGPDLQTPALNSRVGLQSTWCLSPLTCFSVL